MPIQKDLGTKNINLDELMQIADSAQQVSLDKTTYDRIEKNRAFLEQHINISEDLIYGINTGFGSLCDVAISKDQIEQLQYNLIVSHACGQGDEIPVDMVGLMMLLKIRNLSLGYSGVRSALVEKLVQIYNSGIRPVIYELGSLGASGDLVPLAHMSLALIGKGECWYDNKRMRVEDALKTQAIDPMTLSFKEGLALINGTQFSLAYAAYCTYHAEQLMNWANLISSLSVQAFLCSMDPFDEKIHMIRNQKGQIEVAGIIRDYCKDSKLLNQHYETVQDPYSFRCIPQVHGASLDGIRYVKQIVERELDAVTDNPNVFDAETQVLSGGNFHAQPLALSMDHLAICLSEIGNISERRIFKLVSGERGLPDYLSPRPGLNSGFMIPQYTAAAIVSQNKQLSSPASVDSITSSKGQEDHVSMSANAGTRCYRIVENLYSILAIEFMSACQAIDLREGYTSSPGTKDVFESYRKIVKPLVDDRLLHEDIARTKEFLKTKKPAQG